MCSYRIPLKLEHFVVRVHILGCENDLIKSFLLNHSKIRRQIKIIVQIYILKIWHILVFASGYAVVFYEVSYN